MTDATTRTRVDIAGRAPSLLASPLAEGSDDDLLLTEQVAEWFRVTMSWLEVGRSRGYGPPFFAEQGIVRYRRGDVRNYLRDKTRTKTNRERRDPGRKAGRARR